MQSITPGFDGVAELRAALDRARQRPAAARGAGDPLLADLSTALNDLSVRCVQQAAQPFWLGLSGAYASASHVVAELATESSSA